MHPLNIILTPKWLGIPVWYKIKVTVHTLHTHEAMICCYHWNSMLPSVVWKLVSHSLTKNESLLNLLSNQMSPLPLKQYSALYIWMKLGHCKNFYPISCQPWFPQVTYIPIENKYVLVYHNECFFSDHKVLELLCG